MDLWNVEELYHPLPTERGMLRYWGKELHQFEHNPVEEQVDGSLSRYNHPQYRRIHSKIGKKIEEIIGRKLYPTYFYDRYYFPGQELTRHADRDACEISVTMHISSNLKEPWALWIKTPENSGNIIFESPYNFNSYREITSYHDEFKNSFNIDYNYYFSPFEGRMIVFPSHLQHQVTKNKSNEDRISVSFNIRLSK